MTRLTMTHALLLAAAALGAAAMALGPNPRTPIDDIVWVAPGLSREEACAPPDGLYRTGCVEPNRGPY